MGGGGGYGFSPSDKKHLEEMAQKKIKEAGEVKMRNVFISFAYEDIDEVNLLRGQSKNVNSELDFSDYSVKKSFNSEDADYIKRQIREKIKNTSITMVYLSEKSMKSDWVKWEIEQSKKMGKGVVGVYKGDTPPKRIPSHIKDNVNTIVNWNHSEVMSAINKASEER
jgi:hypothetical protein